MKTPEELSEGRRERLEHMAVKSAQQQGEIAVLTAENARLRAACQKALDTAESWHEFHFGSDITCDDLCAIIPQLQAALEPK